MLANTLADNSRYGRAESDLTNTIESFIGTVTDALQSSDADGDLIDAVETEGKQVAETVGELRAN